MKTGAGRNSGNCEKSQFTGNILCTFLTFGFFEDSWIIFLGL